MAKRNNDFIFIFNGGFPFAQQFRTESEVSLVQYEQAVAKLNHGRTLVAESRGADPNIDANVAEVMTMIRKATKDRLDTVGQVCLLGRSNGCSLALGVAAELNDQGITDIAFIGVSDVTMFASGRSPGIKKVGTLQPTNDPISTAAKSPGFFDGRNPFTGGDPVPENAIPSVRLSQEIKAKAGNKVNLFQIQGNHMKYARSVERWIWWSDLSLGEVHGKLDSGFENRQRVASGSNDLLLHINLNTGPHWKQMMSEAATALATFSPEVLAP